MKAWGRMLTLCTLALTGLASCREEDPITPQATRALQVVAVRPQSFTEMVTLTGSLEARVESDLSFRTSGEIVERLADTGDHVTKGDLLARLDQQLQLAQVASAEAEVALAAARISQTAAAFIRARALLDRNAGSRSEFEAADQDVKVARADAVSAEARLASARETLSHTELRADADGIIVSRQRDVGEVAAAAATIFTLAHDGPRDGVFDVSESLLFMDHAPPVIAVGLASDPSIVTQGHIRQISPVVDAQTGTVRIEVALDSVPAGMNLGAAVTGTAPLPPVEVFELPVASLTSSDGLPAVWLVDPDTRRLSTREIGVLSYGDTTVIADGGLQEGDRVVTQGTKLLRDGQTVTFDEKDVTR